MGTQKQPRQHTYAVLDAQVLNLGLVEDVFRMLHYFEKPGNSAEELRTKGYITLQVVSVAFDGLGVRLVLRNNPRDLHISLRHEHVLCVVEVPDESELEADKFLGRYAD